MLPENEWQEPLGPPKPGAVAFLTEGSYFGRGAWARREPSFKSKTTHMIPDETVVIVLDQDRTQSQVMEPCGRTGWVMSYYLRHIRPPQ